MQLLKLGETDLTVSRAALGTMTFGSQVDAATAASMVDLSIDRGINFIDTANVYNGGESERILGDILDGRRDRIVLASKVGMRMGNRATDAGLSSAAIEIQLDKSLARLRTDYVDLYYLHQPDPQTPIAESLETMHRLVQSGKIRWIGTSNYAAWQVVQLLAVAKDNDWAAPRVAQQMYNAIARGIDQEFLPMSRETATSVVAYNPLAGGLLTGKHPPQAPLDGSRFSINEAYRNRYWHPANFQAIQALDEIAHTLDGSLTNLSLRWLQSRQDIDSIVLGVTRLEQLQQNLDALALGSLPDEVVSRCDRVWEMLRGPVPKYNR